MRKVYIVGAHSRAQTLAVYLKYLYPDISVEAYLVNNGEENAECIADIPVIHFERGSVLNKEYTVYIGTRSVYHKKLVTELRQYGFKRIYPVTLELDLQLRNAYLEKYFASVGRSFIKIDQLEGQECVKDSLPRHGIYVVRSIGDKKIQQPWKLKDYEKEIQAGAALTDQRLSEEILTDHLGENISDRNRQFCELTALYWIWKNSCEDVVGMVHYRRHFILPDDWLKRMEAYNIDVVLPVPLYVAPSLEENYKLRHDPSDWEYLMDYFKMRDEETYRNAKLFFDGNLYSPCNMFIMKKPVLNDLCEWLFPILEAVAVHGGEKKDGYLNRYPGFISERLISYFFERYRDKYRLVYADKNFLQ